MAQGNGDAVGRVIWLWDLIQLQEPSDHFLDLLFICAAVSRDRLFHFGWCVLGQGYAALRCGQQRNAARLTDSDRGRYIASKKELFNGHLVGAKFPDESCQILKISNRRRCMACCGSVRITPQASNSKWPSTV